MSYESFFVITSLFVTITYIIIEFQCMECRCIKRFLIEIIKSISILMLLSFIIKLYIYLNKININTIGCIGSILIILTSAFYIIDKFFEYRINSNYLKYFIYEIQIIYICTYIKYDFNEITFFTISILILLRLLDYKKIIKKNSEYDNDVIFKDSIVFLVYICISAYIVNIKAIIILINLLPYFTIVFARIKSSKDINNCNLEHDELDDSEVFEENKLYDTRKNELSYVLKYITEKRENINEPYAFSISGKWGEGKSSFINVLKHKLRDKYIIFELLPMVTDTRESLVKLFYDNLEQYFMYYGISIGRGSSLDEYFKTIIDLIGKKANLDFENILKLNDSKNESLRDKKHKLQEDINLLNNVSNKKILIVVDDFDRVDNTIQYYVLTFIKEIINFNKIDSIILLDYDKINDNSKDGKSITYDFLEKFINKRFELSKLDRKEIIDYYHDIQTNKECDNFLERELNKVLVDLYGYLLEIEMKLKKEKESLEGYLKKAEDKLYGSKKISNTEELPDKGNLLDEINKMQDGIDNLINLLQKIDVFVSNSRKLKRIIRELDDKIFYAKYLYSDFDESKQEDLINKINTQTIMLGMVLVKSIYENEFDNILSCKCIKEYLLQKKDEEEYLQVRTLILKGILEINKSQIEYNLLNKIQYRKLDFIDNMFISINTPKEFFDFEEEKDKLKNMLENGKIKFENEKTIGDNILELYKKIPITFTECIDKVSNYLIDKLKNKEILDEDLINLIQIKYNSGIIIKNGRYINELEKYIKSKGNINYISNENKNKDVICLELCEEEIIANIKFDIIFILVYKTIGSNGKSYDLLKSEMEDIKTIEELNKYLELCKTGEKLDISSKERCDDLIAWVNSDKWYNDNKYNKEKQKRIDNRINILKSVYSIKEIVEKSTIEKNIYTGKNYIEIMNNVNSIRKKIDAENTEEQIYNLCKAFFRIIYMLSYKANGFKVSDIDKKILDEIYEKIISKDNFIKQFKESELDLLTLNLKSIKVDNKSRVEKASQ